MCCDVVCCVAVCESVSPLVSTGMNSFWQYPSSYNALSVLAPSTIHHIHSVSRQATFKGDLTLEDDSEDDYTMQVQSELNTYVGTTTLVGA